jgi:cyclophilin family peptidyl-prolyl cis-trans isomerase
MSAPGHRRPAGHARIEAAKAARERAARRRQQRPYILGAAAVVVVAVIAVLVLTSGTDNSSSTTATTVPSNPAFAYGTAACAPASTPSPPVTDFPNTNGFQQCISPDNLYTATFDTSAGTIVANLDTTQTPGTTNNFVELAGWGYYDGTKLFRTDPSIGIVQGGAPHTNSAADQGPGFTIPDEGGPFTYKPGQLVMARTNSPNSAGAQFFFTVTDKVSSLDAQGTYVVFGTVTKGLDILQTILASNQDQPGGLGGAPSPPVTIKSVTIGQASIVGGTGDTTPG